MTTDEETLKVYADRATDYARLTDPVGPDPILEDFITGLAPGASVLDLGCGPGAAAAAMRDAGLHVIAMDASPQMVALAKSTHDIDAICAPFDTLASIATYGGIWASFSLLHARKAELPDLLARIHRALRAGGRFGLGMKSGSGEARDTLGRFYAYYSQTELYDLLTNAGFQITETRTGIAPGLDGVEAPWIWIDAHA